MRLYGAAKSTQAVHSKAASNAAVVSVDGSEAIGSTDMVLPEANSRS